MNRFSDAINAQAGACNPIALINALKRGIDEIRGENPICPTDKILSDPGLRLQVHQIAFLFKANDGDQISAEYNDLCEECEKRKK